jgi:hypothetical protein
MQRRCLSDMFDYLARSGKGQAAPGSPVCLRRGCETQPKTALPSEGPGPCGTLPDPSMPLDWLVQKLQLGFADAPAFGFPAVLG